MVTLWVLKQEGLCTQPFADVETGWLELNSSHYLKNLVQEENERPLVPSNYQAFEITAEHRSTCRKDPFKLRTLGYCKSITGLVLL